MPSDTGIAMAIDLPKYTGRHEYKAVPVSDANTELDCTLQEEGQSVRSTRSSFLERYTSTILITLLSLTIILLILVIAVAVLSRYQTRPPTSSPLLYCGNTTKEAEALGCEFDPLTISWLHPDCPRGYTEEFIAYNNGKPFCYYYDDSGSRHIEGWNDLAQLGYYWSSTFQRSVHCSFILRRGRDARSRGARIDSMAGDLGYSDYCIKLLVDSLGKSRQELDRLDVYGEVEFLTC